MYIHVCTSDACMRRASDDQDDGRPCLLHLCAFRAGARIPLARHSRSLVVVDRVNDRLVREHEQLNWPTPYRWFDDVERRITPCIQGCQHKEAKQRSIR